MRMTNGWKLLVLAGTAAFAAGMALQPADPPARDPNNQRERGRPRQPDPRQGDARPEDQPRRPMDREAFTERLRKRAEDLQRQQQKVAHALDQLQHGEDVEKVQRELGADAFERPARNDSQRPGRPSPEDRARLMEFLKENAPAVSERIAALGEQNPVLVERMMMRVGPNPQDLMSLKGKNEAMYTLKLKELEGAIGVVEQSKIVGKFIADGQGDTAEAAIARKNMREAVATLFDIRAEIQGHEVQGLEERVKAVREEMQRKRESREQAIDRWTQELVKGAEMLGKVMKDGPRREDGRQGPPRGPGNPGPDQGPRPPR